MELSPVYGLIGEEDYLKNIILSKIKKQCLPSENTDSFNYISIDGKATTSAGIVSECQQLPFMGDFRLIVIKDADKIIDDKILEYIKNPVKTTCLVLLIHKLDKRLSAYKVLEKHALIQEFNHPNEKDICIWIQRYLKDREKNISQADTNRLAGILDNNLTGIRQELEKLITYTGQKDTIGCKDIENIISENRTSNSFALTEAIQNKDTSTAIKTINKLLEQGDAVQQITGTIRWMITRLWECKELLKTCDRTELSKQLRIPSYFLEKFIRQAEKFQFAELKTGLVKLFELEKTIRTYKIPHNLALELLAVQLTQKTSE